MIFETKTIDAAIFDMDGTMFDTEKLRMRMLQQASDELFNESMSDQLLIDSLGLSAKAAEELAKKRYGNKFPYKEIRKRADELEVEYVRNNGVPVKEGLYNVLERLKKSDVLIALATSSRREIAEEYLLNAKVMRFFDVTVCGDEITKGKPNPEIFLKAAAELNCNPEKCLIFEDSQNGLISAADSNGLPIYIKDLKDPIEEVKERAYKKYESMKEFLNDLVKYTQKMPTPKINEHFPQSVGHCKAGIHGFGAIGGGYLTQIFTHWDGYTRPISITGATKNYLIRDLINAFDQYIVKYDSIAYHQTISGVHIIDINDINAMNKMYIESDIIGLSLPETVIKLQANVIAGGLIERDKNNGGELTILIVLNKINGGIYVKKIVFSALKELCGIEKAKEIMNKTYFAETVVNRMVSTIPDEDILFQVQNDIVIFKNNIIQYQPEIDELFQYFNDEKKTSKKTSKKKLKNQTTIRMNNVSGKLLCMSKYIKELSLINIALFSSEPDMIIYSCNASPLLNRLRQVEIVDDISVMQDIKNKLSNGTHAIIAWYSALLGYNTIGQGIGDKRVFLLAKHVMAREIKPPLINENPKLSSYINGFISNFIKRCRVSFKDTCKRVGRDPLRKLQNGERIFGNIALAKKYGLNTDNLEFGAACAILYSVKGISGNDKEANKIKEIYEINNSVVDVLTYAKEYNGAKYKGLDKETDFELIKNIEDKFCILEKSLEETDNYI
jgi:HAD superfamily hydrolase (TIGR01509 family)